MERTEYIIISDKERKDFNCPGYIQRILNSPAGTRIIVRVYSPTDQDSMGTEHCLNVDQVASVDKTVFRKRFDQIIFARKDRENVGKNMTLNELGISRRNNMMKYGVKEIIYHDAATIVYWTDGTKTVVKCNENDVYSEYAGFAAAVAKKMYGGANAINRLIDSKKVIHGNGLGQPFRSEKTFEDVLSEAAKKVTENIKNSLQTP